MPGNERGGEGHPPEQETSRGIGADTSEADFFARMDEAFGPLPKDQGSREPGTAKLPSSPKEWSEAEENRRIDVLWGATLGLFLAADSPLTPDELANFDLFKPVERGVAEEALRQLKEKGFIMTTPDGKYFVPAIAKAALEGQVAWYHTARGKELLKKQEVEDRFFKHRGKH